MDRMKQLDISFLLAFALGHLEDTYKKIDRLYEGGRERYDLAGA